MKASGTKKAVGVANTVAEREESVKEPRVATSRQERTAEEVSGVGQSQRRANLNWPRNERGGVEVGREVERYS